MHPTTISILGQLEPNRTKWHEVTPPAVALADEARRVTTITGAKPGPLHVDGVGMYGCEYPAVETVIGLVTELNAPGFASTTVLIPALNLPACWQRTSFVCPVDDVKLYRSLATVSEAIEKSSSDSILAGSPPIVARHTGSCCANQVVIDRRCGFPD